MVEINASLAWRSGVIQTGNDTATLSTELQQAILRSGLSLNQLGKETGVSQAQISRFVSGARTLTLPAADKLCRYLGLKLTAFSPSAAIKE